MSFIYFILYYNLLSVSTIIWKTFPFGEISSIMVVVVVLNSDINEL